MKYTILGMMFFCIAIPLKPDSVEPFVSFQDSMGPRGITFGVISKDDRTWLEKWQHMYENHNLSVAKRYEKPRIPLIIHQVWLGKEPFPFEEARQSILKHHPDWEYRLWTDADVESFGLVNKKLFDAAKNYGERADIFRYEILERYGGVYLDADMHCVKPLDILHHCYEFYTGILNSGTVELGIGIIGTRPGHPIIKLCVSAMTDIGSKRNPMDIIGRTGPWHFTKCFISLAYEEDDSIIALPVSFFYPIPNVLKTYRTFAEAAPWVRPETFTVHYWGCTWQRPSAFIP
jgi:mannosyltransferase OCH1-like enzyme